MRMTLALIEFAKREYGRRRETWHCQPSSPPNPPWTSFPVSTKLVSRTFQIFDNTYQKAVSISTIFQLTQPYIYMVTLCVFMEIHVDVEGGKGFADTDIVDRHLSGVCDHQFL